MQASERFSVLRPGGAYVKINDETTGLPVCEFPNQETAEAVATAQWNGEDLTIMRITCTPVSTVTGSMQVVVTPM